MHFISRMGTVLSFFVLLIVGSVASGAETAPAQPLDEKAIAQERARLITPLLSPDVKLESQPDQSGSYFYGAASAKPLVTSSKLELQQDKAYPGLVVANVQTCRGTFSEQPDVHGAYWKLGQIKPGRYYVGVLSQGSPPPVIFLNGRIAQASRRTDEVQAKPGFFVSETQVDEPLELKPGDEIAVQIWGRLSIVQLALRPTAPQRGRHPVALQFGGGNAYLFTSHALGVEVTWKDKEDKVLPRVIEFWTSEQQTTLPETIKTGPDGRPLVTATLFNPLPVPMKVNFEMVIRSYYRNVVGSHKEQLVLQPHESVERLVQFSPIADEPSYSAHAKIEAVDKPDLGWPEGDTVSFFPGLRHTIPWTNPYRHQMLRRVEFTHPIASVRQVLNLNGEWEKAVTTEWRPTFPVPADLTFGPGKVPMGWHTNHFMKTAKPRLNTVYLRRKFTLPPEAAGRTYNLVINAAQDGAAVWINGQFVGQVLGGNTPLNADATKAVKVGENDIVIQVLNLLALMNPDYVDAANPTPSPFYLDIPGFFSGDGCGIENVSIQTSPVVASQDIQALPSFRNKDLTARYSIISHLAEPAKVRVKTHVLDEGKSVLTLDERELTLEPSKPVDIQVKKAWPNPRLWDPRDPHLYVIAVETFDAATGKLIDLARERFGFRECWIDGPRIMFNGTAIRPKGCFENRDECATLTRGTQRRPDYYDEMGRMGFHFITQLTNSASRHNLERDQYWESCRTNAIKSLKQAINHPSVVAWDLSNEWLWYMDYYSPDPMLGPKRFMSVSDHVRAYDPSRWTMFNGEGDLSGLLDNHAYHYMDPFHGTERITGYMAYYPDAEFWRPLDRHFKHQEEVPLSPFKSHIKLRPHEKVMMDTEFLWKVNETMPPHLTQFCGELDVLGNAADSSSGPSVWFWKTKIDGHRDLGVSPIHHYRLVGIHSRACPPRTFLMPDTAHNGFAGQKLVKLITMINDESTQADTDLRWELLLGDKEVLKGNESLQMQPGSKHPTQIELTLPDAKERTRFVLRVRMYVEGIFVIGSELDIDVWPNLPITPGSLARKVFLVDPSGETAKVLQHAGVPFELLGEIAPPAGQPDKALVILGERILTEESAQACTKLMDFVHAGGRVLVLTQTTTPAGLPADTKLDKARWASICFPRMESHPILQGVTDWDISFWAKDRVVGQGCYTKPDSGMAMSIIDSGGSGLEYVQLMEQYRGKGMHLLCQLPLVGKYNQEPMTRELLARILNYAGNSEAYLKPTSKLQALVAADGDIRKRLEDVTVHYEPAKFTNLAPDRPVLVEASFARQAGPEALAALEQFIRAGGTAAVAYATPEDAPWLTKLAGTEVKFTVLPYANWLGRGMREGFSPFTASLSHLDLYYKQYDLAESGGSQSEDLRLVIEPLQDYALQAAGAKQLAFPGLLMELKVGGGTLLIDQRRWATPNSDLIKLASRNLTSLMLGMGVELATVVPLRQLPSHVAYQTIDITELANRSLMDDKSEDGIGGWSDQGPGADLRNFKTGKLNLQGVPFMVGDHPKSCIVLTNPNRAGHKIMPKEVTIPVGKAVEGFYFLHGFAWGGNKLACYDVQYEDGTNFEIDLIGGVNVKDWVGSPTSNFPREKLTTSTVAWTGSSSMFPVVAVYKMLWVNPKPEVPVKSICFRKNLTGGGVPILMGVTSITSRQIKTLTPEEQARVGELVKQANEAAGRKDIDAAQALLRQALEMNPQAWEIYQSLADLLEQKGSEEARMDFYLSWVGNGAIVPLPYNRIAEMLEKQKDLRGALEYYTRSLKVEWNQPPVIENKKRLEAELRK